MPSSNTVEFWDNHNQLASSSSAIVPPVGSKVMVQGAAWTVKQVTYEVLNASRTDYCSVTAHVALERA